LTAFSYFAKEYAMIQKNYFVPASIMAVVA